MSDNSGDNEHSQMILVIHRDGRSWVHDNADWHADWLVQGLAHVSNKKNKYMFDRRKALTLAHDIQNRRETYYGVWEVFL